MIFQDEPEEIQEEYNPEKHPDYYIVIPAFIWHDEGLNADQKMLYGQIATLSSKFGYCWPSNKYLSKVMKVSKQTISTWLSKLSNKKLIVMEYEFKKDSKEILRRKIYLSKGNPEYKQPPNIKTINPIQNSNNTPSVQIERDYSNCIKTSNNNADIPKTEENVNPHTASLVPCSSTSQVTTTPVKLFNAESSEYYIAYKFWMSIKNQGTFMKEPDLQSWSKEIDKIHRIDKRSYDKIYETLSNVRKDPFWVQNMKSPKKFREQLNKGILDKFVPKEKTITDEEFIIFAKNEMTKELQNDR